MSKKGKEKIIQTAFELFLKKGYKKTSLADIIEKTQLSKGAIYHHFSSKYQIYLATLEEYFFKLYKDFQIDDKHQNFKQRIENRFKFFVDLIDYVEQSGDGISFPIRCYFQFQLESEENEEVRNQIIITLEEFRKDIQQIVEKAVTSNEIIIELSSKIITMQLTSMIEGIAIHHSTLENNVKAFLEEKFNEIIIPYINLLIKK